MPERAVFVYNNAMGTLYIIGTPIGNLEDITKRALYILKQVDLILAEDSRVTKKLLARYQISKPIVSYHQHSRLTKVKYILEQLKRGKDLALVSDAGTPGISDPGAKLIQYLVEQAPGLKIVPIPGASALITALSVAGLPADKFVFLGFPPAKKKRKKFFQEVVGSKHTIVFYESPHRILKTLQELPATQEIVVCRELTKKFETIYRGQAGEIIKQIDQDKVRGEFVVIIGK